MAEVKKLLHPKVAVPMVGLLVLITVGTLVAVFYIRNPTITDGLFTHDSETTSSPENAGDHEHRVEAVTSGVPYPSSSNSSGSSSLKLSSASNHFTSSANNLPFTRGINSATDSSGITATTMSTNGVATTEGGHSMTGHAIEPVEHV